MPGESVLQLSPIIHELIGIGIGSLIGLSARQGHEYLTTTKPARSLWRFGDGKNVTLVTADPMTYTDDEFTTAVYPQEYAAVTELTQVLCRLFPQSNPLFLPANYATPDRLTGNLIVIGGPVHNRWAESVLLKFVEELDTPIGFDGYDLVDRRGGPKRYAATVSNGKIVEDYGLIVAGRNPFNHTCRAIVVAGCRVFGTLAAARSLLLPEVKYLKSRLNGASDFAAIVRADVHYDVVTDQQVVRAYPLRRLENCT
jgi:hypothetical protein